MAVQELKTQYLIYVKDLSSKMLETGSIYDVMIKRMLEEFKSFGISSEQKSELLATTLMNLIEKFETLAESSARDLMTLESELPIKDKQALEVVRKTQYYDDRLLETVTEKQADLASFAVNANSDSAQTTINDLKAKMFNLESRVVPISGNDCPAPIPVIAIPTGLSVDSTSDTSLTISWLPVTGATLYVLYQDGIQIASTGNLSVISSGLTQVTKYAYSVRAFSGGYYSDLSLTVVGTTQPTVP